jgi:hypothetical protein
VDHACNTGYSGGRDQEDHGSKPVQANSSTRPYLEKTLHKNRAGGVAESVGPEFKPQHRKKKKAAEEEKLALPPDNTCATMLPLYFPSLA